MTVASAVELEPEAVVEFAVSSDPALALGAAEVDGLLTYHGLMTAGSYEIELFGRVLVLPGSAVREFVTRLRAVLALKADGFDVRMVDLADGERVHVLEVRGERVRVPDDQVLDWCEGFRAAAAGGSAPVVHSGEGDITELARLFREPSMHDQMRMVLLGLMHGGPDDRRVGTDELAWRVDAAKKTIGNALRFDGFLPPPLAEKMIWAFGLRWALDCPGGVARLDGNPLEEPLPEMPALVALRRIVAAVEAGFVQYLDSTNPNTARWLRTYALMIGNRSHVIDADRVLGWLAGVEAFHQGQAGQLLAAEREQERLRLAAEREQEWLRLIAGWEQELQRREQERERLRQEQAQLGASAGSS